MRGGRYAAMLSATPQVAEQLADYARCECWISPAGVRISSPDRYEVASVCAEYLHLTAGGYYPTSEEEIEEWLADDRQELGDDLNEEKQRKLYNYRLSLVSDLIQWEAGE